MATIKYVLKSDKILAIAGFLCITAALCVVVVRPPVAGYEMSIYDAYPWYFWLAVCTGLSCGILIVLRQALTEEGSNWWLVGLLIIVMANSVVLLLPFFHGYLVYGRNDALSHLMVVKDIVSAGKVAAHDYYPASHVLAASLSEVCGVEPAVIINCLPAFFSVIYVLGVCSLAFVVGNSRGQVLLISALGTVLLFSNFGSTFLPTHFAFAIVPLILFLFYRSMSGMGTSVVFVILLLLMPILHIFGCVMLAGIFLLYGLSQALWNRLSREGGIAGRVQGASYWPPALLVLVGGFAWYWSFAAFGANANSIVNFIEHGVGERPADTYQSAMTTVNTSVFDLLCYFVRGYGHEFIYAVMAGIAVLVIIRRVYWTRKPVASAEIFFGLVFVVFALAFFPFLFGSLLFLNPLRELEWALMAGTVVSGMVFYGVISPKQEGSRWRLGRKTASAIVALVLVVSSIIGVFGAYYSPLAGLTNAQVTRAEMTGMQWFLTHLSPEAPTINVSHVSEFAWRGLSTDPGSVTVGTKVLVFSEVPPHFDYQQESTLAPDLRSGGYLVITRCDRLQASEIWREKGKFTTGDFDRLNDEPSLARVYVNGELEVWVGSLS